MAKAVVEAKPRFSQKRAKERSAAICRPSVRAPTPSARRSAMKARTSAAFSEEMAVEAGRFAQMACEEAEELFEVAPVGLERFVGEPPLAAEMADPVERRLPKARRRRDENVPSSCMALHRRSPVYRR